MIAVSSSEFLIGRHPSCAFPFDPDSELAVSTRHAVIERRADGWWLRDLGSTNGTWHNAKRIDEPVKLVDGDRILFGQGGPLAEWKLQRRVRESTTKRIRAQVARHMRHVRLALLAAAVIVVAGAGWVLHLRNRAELNWQRERSTLQQQIDSLLFAGEHAVRSLQGEMRGLSEALLASEARVRQVNDELRAAQDRLSADQTDQLRRQLQDARESLRRQYLAASLDFRTIERLNRQAVTMVYAESAAGVVSTATAFAIRADGLLVTSRHVVSDSTGQARPRRLAVQFSDSDQFWNAHVVAVSRDADLALIRVVDIVGDVPTIHGIKSGTDAVAAGAPVAIIGFPLGGNNAPGTRRAPARPLISAAVVKAVHNGRLEIEGYGAAGASGSPILDRNAEVVGVLYGGYRDPDSGESVILAVPVTSLVEFVGAR